jgi:hypothetical protein
MSTAIEPFLSVAQLTRHATIYLGQTLPEGLYQSMPLPAYAPHGLILAFFFGRGEAVNGESGYQVWPPRYVASFECATGRLERLASTTPAWFRRSDETGAPLGPGFAPPAKMQDDYLAGFIRYAQTVDRLLPAFAARLPVPDSLRADATDALAAFSSATEDPLRPYYEYVGSRFLRWLRRASRAQRRPEAQPTITY